MIPPPFLCVLCCSLSDERVFLTGKPVPKGPPVCGRIADRESRPFDGLVFSFSPPFLYPAAKSPSVPANDHAREWNIPGCSALWSPKKGVLTMTPLLNRHPPPPLSLLDIPTIRDFSFYRQGGGTFPPALLSDCERLPPVVFSPLEEFFFTDVCSSLSSAQECAFGLTTDDSTTKTTSWAPL